jgi:COP9 signalosome complex subunit 1
VISISYKLLTVSAGRTRFERLYTIGTSSTHLCFEALKAAVAEAKQGKDVQRYEIATSALQEIAPQDPDAVPDQAWIDRTKKQVKAETDKMELELKGYKNNLIKESIRVCETRKCVRICQLM